MHQAFEESPQMVLTPAEAYERIIKKEAEFVELADIGGRTAASVVAPYPPGIPLIMGGELVRPDSAAFRYLELLQSLRTDFPDTAARFTARNSLSGRENVTSVFYVSDHPDT